MIFHELNKEGILYIVLTDKVNKEDILNFLKEFQSFDHLPEDVKLLYNFQKAEIDLAADQLKEIAELADIVTEKYQSVKTAFLVDEPVVTAYSYLFSRMDQKENRERKVFSTHIAAEEWLIV